MIFSIHRATVVLLALAPLAVQSAAPHACAHRHREVRAHHRQARLPEQQDTLFARRRKRGSRDRDDLPDTKTPQIPPELVSRDTMRHFANEAARAKTPAVPPRQDKHYRRRLIAENIRVLREAKGLSQDQLAKRMRIDRRNILRWEGAYNEPGDHLYALARALGVGVGDLYADPKTTAKR